MSVLYGKENIRIRRIQRLQPNYTEDPRKTTKHKKVPWIPCAHRKCRRLHQTVDQTIAGAPRCKHRTQAEEASLAQRLQMEPIPDSRCGSQSGTNPALLRRRSRPGSSRPPVFLFLCIQSSPSPTVGVCRPHEFVARADDASFAVAGSDHRQPRSHRHHRRSDQKRPPPRRTAAEATTDEQQQPSSKSASARQGDTQATR